MSPTVPPIMHEPAKFWCLGGSMCKVLVSWGFNVHLNACEIFQLRRGITVVIHEFCTHDDPCNGCRAHAPGV